MGQFSIGEMGQFSAGVDNKNRREQFADHVARFFANFSGVLIAAGIDKKRHIAQYRYPMNPYSIALLFCLERIYGHLKTAGVHGETMTCVFEKRGKAEDNELAAQFARIVAGDNQWGELPFKIAFASKLANMPGLQMADLAAYPIARHILDRNASNPSFDAIKPHIRRSPRGEISGWGLKIFP